MICTTCKAEFCWTCLGPWEPHGSSWYHCNRFNETDAQQARGTQAVSSMRIEAENEGSVRVASTGTENRGRVQAVSSKKQRMKVSCE